MSAVKGELIICVVNEGFSEDVMDAARAAGATGGTVLSAHGSVNKDAEEFFNINIQPLKNVVLIAVRPEIKDAVLKALYEKCGFDTPSRGIAFSLPLDGIVGLK